MRRAGYSAPTPQTLPTWDSIRPDGRPGVRGAVRPRPADPVALPRSVRRTQPVDAARVRRLRLERPPSATAVALERDGGGRTRGPHAPPQDVARTEPLDGERQQEAPVARLLGSVAVSQARLEPGVSLRVGR